MLGYSGNMGNADEHIVSAPLPAGRYYVQVRWVTGDSASHIICAGRGRITKHRVYSKHDRATLPLHGRRGGHAATTNFFDALIGSK